MGKPTRDDGLTLGPEIQRAVKVWSAIKADGARADADAYLEKAVRDAWPPAREWKYLCDRCNDTGWELDWCVAGARCGRRWCEQQPEYGHEYMRRCVCAKAVPVVRIPSEDVGTAGKVTRRGKGWRQVGE